MQLTIILRTDYSFAVCHHMASAFIPLTTTLLCTLKEDVQYSQASYLYINGYISKKISSSLNNENLCAYYHDKSFD